MKKFVLNIDDDLNKKLLIIIEDIRNKLKYDYGPLAHYDKSDCINDIIELLLLKNENNEVNNLLLDYHKKKGVMIGNK